MASFSRIVLISLPVLPSEARTCASRTDCAWVTVMGNRNTLAVASLADVSCVILAEGAAFAPEDLDCAKKEEITVFYTELPVFEAALAVHALL